MEKANKLIRSIILLLAVLIFGGVAFLFALNSRYEHVANRIHDKWTDKYYYVRYEEVRPMKYDKQ